MKIYIELSQDELYIATLFQTQIFPRKALENIYGTIIKTLADDLILNLMDEINYIEFEHESKTFCDMEIIYDNDKLIIKTMSKCISVKPVSLLQAYKLIIHQLLDNLVSNEEDY